MTNRILRLPEVQARTGLSRSTIYLWIQRGTFPKQLKIGARSSGWLELTIDRWIQQQSEAKNGGCNG